MMKHLLIILMLLLVIPTVSAIAPNITGIPDVNLTEDVFNVTLNLSQFVQDPDTTISSLTWSVFNTPNSNITIVNPIGNFSMQPNFNGIENVIFQVSDGVDTDLALVTVNVTAVNDEPTIPTNLSPTNNSIINITTTSFNTTTSTINLTWNNSTDIENDSITYRITFSSLTPPGFPLSFNYSTTSNFLTVPILNNTDYYYSVMATDGVNNSTITPLFNFKTQFVFANNTPPTTPVLTTPANNSIVSPFNTSISNLTWANSTSANNLSITYLISFTSEPSPGLPLTYNYSTASPNLTIELVNNTRYYWSVIATDGLLNSTPSEIRTFTANVTGTQLPPTQPGLISPTNNTVVDIFNATIVNLTWNNSTDPNNDSITYLVSFSTGVSPGSTTIYNFSTTNTSIQLPVINNTQYFWSVLATDGTTNSTPSEQRTFVTNLSGLFLFPPTTPTLTSPTPGQWVNISSGNRLNLTWTNSTDPDNNTISYLIHFSTVTTPGQPIEYTLTSNTSRIEVIVQNNTQYFWTVLARDAAMNATATETRNFTTNLNPTNQAPTMPVQVSPLNNQLIQLNSTSITLDWLPSTDPNNDSITYLVALTTDSVPGSSLLYNYSTTASQITLPVRESVDYYWSVKATDGIDNSSATSLLKFSVFTSPLAITQRFPTATDILVGDSTQQLFNVTLNNPRNANLSFNWKVNGITKATNQAFTWDTSGLSGTFTIEVEATDSSENVSTAWTATVADKPISRSGKFTGTILTIPSSQLSSATGVVIERPGFGKIDFGNQVIDLSDVVDLDSFVIIERGIAGIDTNQYPTLNKPATITLEGLTYTQQIPSLFRTSAFTTSVGSAVCTSCTLLNYTQGPTSSGTVVFLVPSFSTYRAGNNITTTTPTTIGLVIKDMEIDGDDVKVDPNGRDTVDDIRPDQRITIDLEIENTFSRTDDIEIEDIDVEITIFDIDDGDDLDFDADREFDLDAGDDEDVEIDFVVPLEVEDGQEYEVLVEVFGRGTDGNRYEASTRAFIEIEKDKHDVRITDLALNPSSVECTTTANLDVEVTNLGEDSERRAVLTITNEKLGLNQDARFTLDEDPDDSDFDMFKRFLIRVPADAEEGVYDILVQTYYDDTRLSDSRLVQLNVNNCQESSLTTLGRGSIAEDEPLSVIQVPELKTKETRIVTPGFMGVVWVILLLGALGTMGVAAYAVLKNRTPKF